MLYTRLDLALRSLGPLATVLALAACAFGATPPPARPAAPSSVMTTFRQLPVRLCVPVAAESWEALRRGDTRLVLHLQNQKPSNRYSPSFQVSRVESDSQAPPAATEVIQQFSMHPDPPARESGPPNPQHFSIDLRKHLPEGESPATLCFEVGIEKSEDAPPPDPGGRILIRASLDPIDR